jgi:ABC-type branched-subunit amino acid transport system ATPase component
VDARQDLAGSLDEKLAAMPDETRQEVMANLETIRKAIDEINRALAEQPDNVLLQELLRGSYREELDLMIKVDGVASAAMRRGDI